MVKAASPKAQVSYLATARLDHSKRLLDLIGKGYTITGLRLNHPKKPEEGAVVGFEKGEADAVVAAVAKALKARK